jgi:hypothetical protein
MANAVYPKTKKTMLDAILALGTLKAVLVDTGVYTYSTAHDFYNDVSAGTVGDAIALTGVTTTDGALDCDPFTIPSVSGGSSEAMVFFVDTGNAATSPIIAYIDAGQTGLPITPNGGGISYTPGSNIFQL